MAVDGYDGQNLYDWWTNTAESDIVAMAPKMIEYGGTGSAKDLVAIGEFLWRLGGHDIDAINDEQATELGIAFYVVGKVARWQAAILAGTRVSDDTLKDIAIYAMMARRNRAAGGWPVAPRNPDTRSEADL